MPKKGGKESVVLAADIGGTKTHLGLFVMAGTRPDPVVIKTYSSREVKRVEEIVERFVSNHKTQVLSACLGIAGPVYDGVCRTTNLPWIVSEVGIKRRFNWPHVRLINDLVATASAIPLLKKGETMILNGATLQKGQNIALLAPGTGLGQAVLVFHRGGYVPLASEGGHVDFGPRNEEEIRLWRFLQKQFGHVSPERIVSGPGLVNIYMWLKHSTHAKEPPWLKKMFAEMDPGRVITETGLRNEHPLCTEALQMFISSFGAVAGNLALTSTARGGVFLGGGIPPKIVSALEQGPFMEAFTNKGRFSDYMEEVPVRVILNERSALIGAARVAFEMIDG
ncbi:MAG: glucokinase [Deltaproteobacteria bacterium HGW-Deltaproteobacteria-15]|jgi:glucokinase|nr:MAG: glucokinase [Deltaproteobacteria bacterium HGW-Deltaproteobacteria-15]